MKIHVTLVEVGLVCLQHKDLEDGLARWLFSNDFIINCKWHIICKCLSAAQTTFCRQLDSCLCVYIPHSKKLDI